MVSWCLIRVSFPFRCNNLSIILYSTVHYVSSYSSCYVSCSIPLCSGYVLPDPSQYGSGDGVNQWVCMAWCTRKSLTHSFSILVDCLKLSHAEKKARKAGSEAEEMRAEEIWGYERSQVFPRGTLIFICFHASLWDVADYRFNLCKKVADQSRGQKLNMKLTCMQQKSYLSEVTSSC